MCQSYDFLNMGQGKHTVVELLYGGGFLPSEGGSKTQKKNHPKSKAKVYAIVQQVEVKNAM